MFEYAELIFIVLLICVACLYTVGLCFSSVVILLAQEY